MKANKVIFLLLFPLIAEVLVSCCNCLEPVIKHYTNKTLTINHLDNSGSAPVIASSDTVRKSAYGIRMNLVRETVVCNHNRTSLFISSAYAFKCDCEPPNQILPRDSITALHISTVNDFDATHPAGSDVTEYFYQYQKNNYRSIPDYLSRQAEVVFDAAQDSLVVDFLLMQAPAAAGIYSFEIAVTLSDGRTKNARTNPAQLY